MSQEPNSVCIHSFDFDDVHKTNYNFDANDDDVIFRQLQQQQKHQPVSGRLVIHTQQIKTHTSRRSNNVKSTDVQ